MNIKTDNSSILESLRETICSNKNITDFDADLMMHANATFSILNQLGAGPIEGFQISNEDAVWSDFSNDARLVNLVKTYVQLSVRVLFDPPANSFTLESIKSLIKEYEWRINVMVDPEVNNNRKEYI